jgi:hypothetical protein
LRKRALWVGLVVLLGAGVALGLVYGPSDRDIRNDVYARICTLLTEKQLARPSSMEIIAIMVTKPEPLSKAAALQRAEQDFMPGSHLADAILKPVENDYAQSRPHSSVDVYVTYSALNPLGGAGKSVSRCSYVEKPGFGDLPSSELTIVGIGDSTLTQRSAEWASVTNPAELGFGTVKVEFKDRLNYVLARTYPLS